MHKVKSDAFLKSVYQLHGIAKQYKVRQLLFKIYHICTFKTRPTKPSVSSVRLTSIKVCIELLTFTVTLLRGHNLNNSLFLTDNFEMSSMIY